MNSLGRPAQDEIISSWHERADAYNKLIQRWPIFTDMANRLINFIPNNFNGHAIDIAGGSGLLSECLLKKHPSARITLVEPAENMRALALQKLGNRVDIANATSDSLETLGITADAALCSASFHLMNEATALPSIASILQTGAVFATNCWGHSFNRAIELNQKADWMEFVDQALTEFDLPPFTRPTKTVPMIKSAEELTMIGKSCGLDLTEVNIVTNEIDSKFNIEFTAMSANFLKEVNDVVRKQVIERSISLCKGVDVISSVDLCFKKY